MAELYKQPEDIFLQTQRLVLRRFREEDFSDFCAIALDAERNRLMGNPPVNNLADAQDFFRYMKDEEPRAYALVSRQTRRVIGNLTVYGSSDLQDDPAFADLVGRELSFSMAQSYRRQGLMTEAIQAVIRHLFSVEHADYICDGYFDFNDASRLLHQKLGFSYLSTEQVPVPGGKHATLIQCILRRG